MSYQSKSPTELREMFGANLRLLAKDYASISDLSRQLQINRTQFNRYLSGESFPRPDVLARICGFFKVDARVLLEPVADIGGSGHDPIGNPFLRDYVGSGVRDVTPEMFPSGFYRFSRRSFVHKTKFILGLVFVLRSGNNTYLRGYEWKEAMRIQGLPTDAPSREFRGLVIQQEDGITMLASRKNAMTCSFNYLNRVASFENNFWVGYVTRTMPESANELRATRMVYEYLGHDLKKVMPAARSSGFATEEELMPFHRRLLNPDAAFS